MFKTIKIIIIHRKQSDEKSVFKTLTDKVLVNKQKELFL